MSWWKDAVVYQIYPRSFFDGNGDGVGDLPGITQKLDYLTELGVTVLWLSPVYDSPWDDGGYDIRDYHAILAEFGSLQDFDELLREAHARGLKVMMDLVVNHTSDEHAWFVEARSDVTSPRRAYYIWHGGVNGGPPNRWQAAFGGPAWERDPASGEYYLHLFSRRQPDLNWENGALRRDIYDMMRWWLQRGVDGFRMDVINLISKHPDFPEGVPRVGSELTDGGAHVIDGPRAHEYLHEMNREVLSHHDLITVGEMPGVTPEQARLYTAEDRHELQMVFQFEHVDIGNGELGKWSDSPWTWPQLKGILARWQYALMNEGWNSLYWDNHDQPRTVSRFGDDGPWRVQSAKLLATLLFCLKGTPYIYQGEELGMTNVRFESIAEYRDIETLNAYQELRARHGWSEEQVMAAIHARSRDNARTPMQWSNAPQAGFTTGTPWIGVNPNYPEINAEAARADPDSVFHHFRRLIALRKTESVIRDGSFRLLEPDHPALFVYLREDARTRLLALGNCGPDAQTYTLPENFTPGEAELLIHDGRPVTLARSLTLAPWQGLMLKFPAPQAQA